MTVPEFIAREIDVKLPFRETCDELIQTWGESTTNNIHFIGNHIYQISRLTEKENPEGSSFADSSYISRITFKTPESLEWALLRWGLCQ